MTVFSAGQNHNKANPLPGSPATTDADMSVRALPSLAARYLCITVHTFRATCGFLLLLSLCNGMGHIGRLCALLIKHRNLNLVKRCLMLLKTFMICTWTGQVVIYSIANHRSGRRHMKIYQRHVWELHILLNNNYDFYADIRNLRMTQSLSRIFLWLLGRYACGYRKKDRQTERENEEEERKTERERESSDLHSKTTSLLWQDASVWLCPCLWCSSNEVWVHTRDKSWVGPQQQNVIFPWRPSCVFPYAFY